MIKSELTSADISVLASLLGYKNIFIPQTSFVYETSQALNAFVKNRMRSLERKHILRYELDGTLFVDEKTRKSVEAMCSPDKLLSVNSNCLKGKCSEMYIFIKEDLILCTSKKNRDKVALWVVSPDEMADLLPLHEASGKKHRIKEKMLFEDAETVQRKLHSFERDEAEKCLNALGIKAENIPLMCEILTGNSKYIRIRQLHRARGAYCVSSDEFYVLISNQPVYLCIDEFGVLNFESLSAETLVNRLSEKLEE